MTKVTRNFISEDDIEQATIALLSTEFDYQHLNCYTADSSDLNDGSGRTDKKDVILKDRVIAKCVQLNPQVPLDVIETAVSKLMDRRGSMSAIKANMELYTSIRDGASITYEDANGEKYENVPLKLIDFENPENNEFLVVSQLWIQSTGRTPHCAYRRPDLILYVNGLPLVFIELKNSNVKLKNAFDDNLKNYKNDIPQLFLTNAFCVLSNATDTKLGSFTAEWEHFFNWLRVDHEKEKVNKEEIEEQGTSIEYLLRGLCRPKRLLDYIENFILFQNEKHKIIAQNHQFLGVNHAFKNFLKRDELKGRLGVFWHTQGSGKSFSMIFYVRKIYRKVTGNFSFVVITDREDLDSQIYKNFIQTKAVLEDEAAQPKNSTHLRSLLSQNTKIVFTLIQKFRYEKGQEYPQLFNPDEREVIVIVDEAHRTQYESLAENMRKGLDGAHFLAFTGTPILKQKKTKQWFGEYVSEYTFQQAIEDKATLPLFYEKRVPEVLLQNDDLNEELAEILEDEELNEAQKEKLERKYSTELEVIKRDDRLDRIAQDIVYHFPRRGYLGKGMMVAVDQFTAVRMYEKVSKLWKEELKHLQTRIHNSKNDVEKFRLKQRQKYMSTVQMAVVISDPSAEKERFDKQGLDIQTHIDRLNKVDTNGADIEDNFKDPAHPLQLVFVCAMWLTGFDAPTVSTLYLDKPMKGHTLMQTIARANRVTSYRIQNTDGELVEKRNGEVIDYYNVFRNLKTALKDYGQGTGEDGETDAPVQDKTVLFDMLDEAITKTLEYCESKDINLKKILETRDENGGTFKENTLFGEYADRLLGKDEYRKTFNVHFNTVAALYEACKPNILTKPRPIVSVIQFLHGFIEATIEQQDLETAGVAVVDLLDRSVIIDADTSKSVKDFKQSYSLIHGQKWDLSTVDFDKLKEQFKETKHKNIAIADMRAFLEKKIIQMLKQNGGRINFAERYQEMIDRYNSGATATEQLFEEIQKFTKGLQEEDQRHIREGLTEDELEIYDLLLKDKLTKDEQQQVKLAAKDLISALLNTTPKVLVQDWWKDVQTQALVKDEIEKVLDKDLPVSYDVTQFQEKVSTVFELVKSLAMNDDKWVC